MANVYRYRFGPQIIKQAKKSSTVAVAQGDMIMFTSAGKIKAVAASGDADDVIGIARDASPTTDATNTIVTYWEIGHGTVFECVAAASDAYTFGTPFVMSGAQELTKKTVTDLQATATNVVAVCAQDNAASSTSVLVQFLAGIFQKDIALS